MRLGLKLFKMCRFLYVAALCLYLLPSLHCDNLLCYYSPILELDEERTFQLVLTECPPGELCFTGDGVYGNHSALSTRGCMAAADCGQAHSLRFKGAVYIMTYACCDWEYCNSCPRVTARSLPLMLAVAVVVGSL